MKKTVTKNVKKISFHQLCEAIEAGDQTILEEFDFDTDAPAEDADFTAEFGGEEEADLDADADADADVEGDLEGETEGEDAPATVTIEIDPNGSLVDALHAILDVLEADTEEMVEDDMADGDAEGEDLVEDDTAEGDDLVEDDTEAEGETEDEECEGHACEKNPEEDEELAASAPAAGVHVADKMKETKRTKSTPAVNRKGTADDDLELAPHTEGDAAGTKPTERKKQTPAIDRSATAKSRLTPTKRITNIGK